MLIITPPIRLGAMGHKVETARVTDSNNYCLLPQDNQNGDSSNNFHISAIRGDFNTTRRYVTDFI
jgi:hypothetical protein